MTIKDQHLKAIELVWNDPTLKKEYNNGIALACERITLEMMEKVLEWADLRKWEYHKSIKKWVDSQDVSIRKTTSELVKLYLESL